MRNQLLSEFQKFLINRKLVPEKNVSFYAYWVSKFIVFLNNHYCPNIIEINSIGYDYQQLVLHSQYPKEPVKLAFSRIA